MIYLDYNATTPVADEVKAEMEPFLAAHFGNPSSPHVTGLFAKKAVELSRRRVADALRTHPEEIVFTSGGTEANNLAVKGAALAAMGRGNKIVTTAIEHPSVIESARSLEKLGFSVQILDPDHTGMISPDAVAQAITPRTVVVSIQHANNEVGTIQRIAEIAELCRKRRTLLHVDAVQSFGKIEVTAAKLGCDMITISGHKIYGPKGIGCLYIKKGVRIDPILSGGGQELARRAGTENVPAIVGFGKACENAALRQPAVAERMRALRDRYEEKILTSPVKTRLNGNPFHRLPNTSNISFEGVVSSRIVERLAERLAISTASACATCNPNEWRSSHVLEAMGIPEEWRNGSIRISVGAPTTEADVDAAASLILATLK